MAGTIQDSPNKHKALLILVLGICCILSFVLSLGTGAVEFSVPEIWQALWQEDDSAARLLIWNLRLPRAITGGLVGVCLALSGCILQAVMRNNMASPSTIGVNSGAAFVGYVTLVAFPQYAHILPLACIVGAFVTTMLIYLLAYTHGASSTRIILSGMAVSALFGAYNDFVKIYFADSLQNIAGFLVGGLNSANWHSVRLVLPYALLGLVICIFLPQQMNILLLGEETARALGLRTEFLRFVLITASSLLAGSAIAAAGMISFVGLIVPHISRLLIGSDYRYLFPASALMAFALVNSCDTLGRIIMPPGEVSVSIILSLIGAPFFLYLIRCRSKEA